MMEQQILDGVLAARVDGECRSGKRTQNFHFFLLIGYSPELVVVHRRRRRGQVDQGRVVEVAVVLHRDVLHDVDVVLVDRFDIVEDGFELLLAKGAFCFDLE